jgi:hypothetical protein
MSAHYNLLVSRAAIDWAKRMAVGGDPAGFSPVGVLFLLREYVAAGGDAVRAAAEHGLTRGLAAVESDPDVCTRMLWLRTLSEAGGLSDDERLRTTVDAALPAAIDSLEALVRRQYEPGEGLLGQSCADHLRCCSALLAAFDLSGRLPYAMLAEELLRHALGAWWHGTDRSFHAGFDVDCTALHVVCRLAGLHATPDYRAAAVVAPSSDYAGDARELAASISNRSGEHPHDAAEFGAAMLEWFALESNLQ